MDCSVEAKGLKFERYVGKIIEPSIWSYFYFIVDGIALQNYFNLADLENDVKITFEKDDGPIDLSFTYNSEKEFELTNDVVGSVKYLMSNSDASGSIYLSQRSVEIYNGYVFLIGVHNKGTLQNYVKIKYEYAGSF